MAYTLPGARDRMMFVDVSAGSGEEKYERVGKGFDTATPSSNTQTQAMQWIDEANQTTTTTSKSIQRAIGGKRAVGDPFNDYFCSMFDKIGPDAETTMVLVDAWDEDEETAGTYKAKSTALSSTAPTMAAARPRTDCPLKGLFTSMAIQRLASLCLQRRHLRKGNKKWRRSNSKTAWYRWIFADTSTR